MKTVKGQEKKKTSLFLFSHPYKPYQSLRSPSQTNKSLPEHCYSTDNYQKAAILGKVIFREQQTEHKKKQSQLPGDLAPVGSQK